MTPHPLISLARERSTQVKHPWVRSHGFVWRRISFLSDFNKRGVVPLVGVQIVSLRFVTGNVCVVPMAVCDLSSRHLKISTDSNPPERSCGSPKTCGSPPSAVRRVHHGFGLYGHSTGAKAKKPLPWTECAGRSRRLDLYVGTLSLRDQTLVWLEPVPPAFSIQDTEPTPERIKKKQQQHQNSTSR